MNLLIGILAGLILAWLAHKLIPGLPQQGAAAVANLPLAFAELLAGGVLITAGIEDPNGSIVNVIKGLGTGKLAPFSTGGASSSQSAGAGAPLNPGVGYKNPFPGASASRVDQGVDYTSKQFLAPGNSKIVSATAASSGWQGGGYIAGQLLDGPYKGKVWYMAEGIIPTVTVGQTVAAGASVANPTANPYNTIVGNIEAGWANPSAPTQPLAQVSTDRAAVALSWNRFVQALGGPLSTNTSSAGYP